MENQFYTIMDSIYKLSLEEKQELKILPEHNIADCRSEEIYLNYENALKEEEQEKLKYYSNISELKNSCDIDFI